MRCVLLLLSGLIFLACSLDSPSHLPPSGLISEEGHTYKIWLPPKFGDTAFTTTYPLLISLHGGTSSPEAYFEPPQVHDPELNADYPCVAFSPNSIAGYGTEVTWLRQTIHRLVANRAYRIDSRRIYIYGFSMGGFGCTNLARDLYRDYGYIVSAIVPSGGGNFPDIPVRSQGPLTASWFHYGLAGDFPQETDYEAAKNLMKGAQEFLTSDFSTERFWDGTFHHFPRETRTLVLDGVPEFKISTYEGMGHTPGPIYQDRKVLDWVFAQRSPE